MEQDEYRLTVRMPIEMGKRLAESAKANHRSRVKEALACIESALRGQDGDQPAAGAEVRV